MSKKQSVIMLKFLLVNCDQLSMTSLFAGILSFIPFSKRKNNKNIALIHFR